MINFIFESFTVPDNLLVCILSGQIEARAVIVSKRQFPSALKKRTSQGLIHEYSLMLALYLYKKATQKIDWSILEAKFHET